MEYRDLVVVGASAGGVAALQTLVAGLPADFPACLLVVMHLNPFSDSHLPQILTRAGPLPGTHPPDGAPLEPGKIYVAPPDRHLLVESGRVRVAMGPKVNRHRPAVDPLFRTAAQVYGRRVIGVILTGNLDDGTVGLQQVKSRGGVSIVQDPKSAWAPSMPDSALRTVDPEFCVPLGEIPPLLSRMVREPIVAEPAAATAVTGGNSTATPSVFTCPECQGPLWEMQNGGSTSYRCRKGIACRGSPKRHPEARERSG